MIWIGLLIVVGFAVWLSRPQRGGAKREAGPDPGGHFGGISPIIPGAFDPGSGPPITYEQEDHIRQVEAGDQQKGSAPGGAPPA